jgi:predicted glutamine amidotransferase
VRADEHKDGFGIAFFEDRGLRHFIDARSARESPVADLVKRYPIVSDNVIAHIRKATQGQVRLENTHPFVRELWGRYWVFAHNGDLKDFHPRLHGAFRPVGDTDSERAFCWLMQELAKAHAGVPGIDELSCTLRELLPQLARHGTFNLLLSNGQALWAHATTAVVAAACPPLRRRDAGRRGPQRRLRGADAAQRPRRHRGHRAADHRRSLVAVCQRRAARVRARRATDRTPHSRVNR